MARVKIRDKRYPGCWCYKLANGDEVYYCAYRNNGKNITAKCGKKSKGYTFRQCHLERADLLRGKKKTRQQLRVEQKQADTRYIDWLYRHYLESRNGKGRNDCLFNKYVLPFWGGKDIAKCFNEDTLAFRKWLESRNSARGGNISPQTVKHCIGLFRRIVRYADKTIREFNLQITDFEIPKVNNEVTEDLNEEEYSRLLHVLNTDKINRPVCDILLLILQTGMRRGEVIKLQWQHVSFERKTILLKEPKGGKDVIIPLSSGAKVVLQRQKKRGMFVFPNKNGGMRGHFERAARRIRDLAGLPKDFRPCHGLRHYYGTELSDKGTDIVIISELLGHKGIEITKRYVKGREEKKQKAVELLAIGGIK